MTRTAMKPWFRHMRLAVAALLCVSAVWLFGAAFCDHLLEPGTPITSKLRWRKGLSMAAGAMVLTALLTAGKLCWDKEDREYRSNRLYKPTPISAQVGIRKGQPILQLTAQFDD